MVDVTLLLMERETLQEKLLTCEDEREELRRTIVYLKERLKMVEEQCQELLKHREDQS
jgi:hypothetical protein